MENTQEVAHANPSMESELQSNSKFIPNSITNISKTEPATPVFIPKLKLKNNDEKYQSKYMQRLKNEDALHKDDTQSSPRTNSSERRKTYYKP